MKCFPGDLAVRSFRRFQRGARGVMIRGVESDRCHTKGSRMTLTWGERPPPEAALRRLHLADAPLGLALSRSVGWSLTLASWERMIAWGGQGAFGIFVGEQLVASTIATAYGRDRAWIGAVITHTDYQRRGFARQVMGTALEHLQERGVRHILLDATPQGRPLYEAFGFEPIYNVEIWTGRASSYLGTRARPLRRDDLAAVVGLDAEVFGAPRGRVIRRLVADYPTLAWVDEDASGALTGFLLAQDDRNHGSLTHLGPWIARSPWSAETLLRTALSVLIGHEVRVDIPDRNTRATIFAHNADLRYHHHCVRMHLGKGDPPDEQIHLHYGVAALATG
jgi:GNAT superfamily N-acetyltransferase